MQEEFVKTVKEFNKATKEFGEVIEKFVENYKKVYDSSFSFRCLVRWDNFIFSIKNIVYRIKHPKRRDY